MEDYIYSSGGPQRSNSQWAVSYSDLITLLLVFFVVIASASQMDQNKMETVQQIFAGEGQGSPSMEKLLADLERVVQQHGLGDVVILINDMEGVRLLIQESLLFPSGSAEISGKAQKIFFPVIAALSELPEYYHLSIEGHTDDVPIRSARYPSNWHLSADRALAVLELFRLQHFEEERLSVRAFGDQRPLLPNRDPEHEPLLDNRRKNRRVVIRIR